MFGRAGSVKPFVLWAVVNAGDVVLMNVLGQ
jgi:hypothetical protein